MATLYETWIATLADLAERALARYRPQVTLEAVEDAEGFSLRRIGGGVAGRVRRPGILQEAPSEKGRLTGQSVLVHLGAGYVLRERVDYPAAARSYLSAVVANQIDRLAPFDAEDAVHAWRIAGEPASPEEPIPVDVSVVSRRRVLEAVRPLSAAGLVPVRAVASRADAAEVVVPLGDGADRTERLQAYVRNAVLGLVALGLVGLAANFWLQGRLEDRLADLQAQAAEKEEEVRRISAERSLAADVEGRSTSIAQDVAAANMLPVLDRLSQLLPDGSYLTEFEAEGRAVRVTGFTDDAAALVPLLEQDDRLSEVAFVGPLSRPADNENIGFDLAFKWQPGAAP